MSLDQALHSVFYYNLTFVIDTLTFSGRHTITDIGANCVDINEPAHNAREVAGSIPGRVIPKTKNGISCSLRK